MQVNPMRYILAMTGLLALMPLHSQASPANASTNSPPWPFPGAINLDKAFCAEGPIIVQLRLDDGEGLPFMVDTGALVTFLDASLTPKLGRRLGSGHIPFPFESGVGAQGIYQMPKLCAGEMPLAMGPRVYTVKLRTSPARPYKGILGMDCMWHYCIQFDFAAGKMVFLDPDHVETLDLGTPFTIAPKPEGTTFFDADLFGQGKMHFLLDTGFSGPFDAMLTPKVFEKLSRENRTIGPDLYMQLADGRAASGSIFPTLNISGQSYTDLWISEVDMPKRYEGIIGMRFLARHKITLNFPKRTFYLKATSSAPLPKPGSG